MALIDILHRLDQSAHTWESPDGSKAVLLLHGGRILGLYCTASEKNIFWTHPDLDSMESGRQFFVRPGWHNSGGDRTWIAPENEFFFPHYPNRNPYVQPSAIDPGAYHITRKRDSVTLATAVALPMYITSGVLNAVVEKTIFPAPNPLLHYHSMLCAELAYAGYSLRTSLQLNQPGSVHVEPRVGLWNLLQLPHGGEMIFSVYSPCTPLKYFGSVEGGELRAGRHLIRYKMTATGEAKIGIPALYSTGRVGYIYSTEQEFVLVVRQFAVNPSADYVDVPFGATGSEGCAAQACNVESELGSFSELEYHTSAIRIMSGYNRCIDTSVLWAFRGCSECIMEAARILLSPDV